MKDVDLIALAGLLHDIGKFGQRAEVFKQKSSIYKNKDYRYTHGAYTAQILYEKSFNLGEEMSDNAAMHHNPQNDYQWIIASADRMASGFEREVFEDYNAEDSENYKQQRLWNIFNEERQFKIDTLSPENIFATDEKSVDNEYNDLWEKFENDLKHIKEKGNSLNDAFTIDYLLKKYTSFIPSSTSFQKGDYKAVKANIPLYEHLKTTAIFTSILYKLHTINNDNIINYYQNQPSDIEQNDMLLIAGDFFGIQNFIFNAVPSSKASKILRAKSAYIQIVTKIVAFYIVETLELSYQSIISTSAGKFEILAVNDQETKDKLEEVQNELNGFFIDNYFGETGIGVSWTECSLADFILPNRYRDNLRKDRVVPNVEASKYKKFNLSHIDPRLFVDEELNNQNLCPLCNKRKIQENSENCTNCEKFVKIGEKLAKSPFMAITKDKTDIEIFGGFYIKFIDDPKVFKNSVVIFDISKDEEFKGYAKWELSSYVKTDQEQKVTTFKELAKSTPYKTEALIALKGDVDFMGNFINTSEVTNSFAKFNFFSSLVDYFFSVYVPFMMRDKNIYTVFAGGDDLFILGAWDEVIELAKEIQQKFKEFSEGSGLTFSVGMVMTKPNKPINFVGNIAEEALEASKEYKKEQSLLEKEKNAITLFGQTVGWLDYEDMQNDFKKIKEMANRYPNEFNTAFWYRLIEFCDMRENMDKDIKNTLWRSKVAYMFRRNIIDKHKNINFDPVIEVLENNIETYGAAFKMVVFEEIYKRRD